jgi:hypothetical protein
MTIPNKDYQSLLQRIASRYEQGRANIAAYVNTEIADMYGILNSTS